MASLKLTVGTGSVNVTVCIVKFDTVTVIVDADRVIVDMTREVTIFGTGWLVWRYPNTELDGVGEFATLDVVRPMVISKNSTKTSW